MCNGCERLHFYNHYILATFYLWDWTITWALDFPDLDNVMGFTVQNATTGVSEVVAQTGEKNRRKFGLRHFHHNIWLIWYLAQGYVWPFFWLCPHAFIKTGVGNSNIQSGACATIQIGMLGWKCLIYQEASHRIYLLSAWHYIENSL